jgi:hypothetical protein
MNGSGGCAVSMLRRGVVERVVGLSGVLLCLTACTTRAVAQSPARYRLGPELARIDGELIQLTRILHATLLADQRLLVVDAPARRIRVFRGSNGARLPDIGRSGGGPGEFQSVSALGASGDTLVVLDGRARRVTRYDNEGRTLPAGPSGTTPDARAPMWQHELIGATARGEYVVLFGDGGFGGRMTPPSTVGICIVSRDGRKVDTLGFVDRRHSLFWVAHEGQFRIGKQRFDDSPLVVVPNYRNEITVVERAASGSAPVQALRIITLRGRGDTLRQVVVGVRPVAIPRQVVSAVVDDAIAVSSRSGIPIDRIRDAVYQPAFWPLAKDAFYSNDDRLWIRREFGSEYATYLVVGATGRVEMELTVPALATVHGAGPDFVWASVVDENDVPSLVRYRLTPEKSPK